MDTSLDALPAPGGDGSGRKRKTRDNREWSKPVLFLDVDGVLNSFFLDSLRTEDIREVFHDPSYSQYETPEGQELRDCGQEFVHRVLSKADATSIQFPSSLFANHSRPAVTKRADMHKGFVMTRFEGCRCPVLYNPVITSKLAHLMKTAQLEAFWATSWRAKAQKHLAPAFGFPALPDSLADVLGNSKPEAVKAVDPRRPLIWLDDDIRCRDWCKLKWLRQRDGPTLAIAPMLSPGLLEWHLKEVEEFCREPYEYHARHGVRIIDEAEVRDRRLVDGALERKDPLTSPEALDEALWTCVKRGWTDLAASVLSLGPPLTLKPPQSLHQSILGGAVKLLPNFVPNLLAAGALPTSDALSEAISGSASDRPPERRDLCLDLLSQLLSSGAQPTSRHLYALIDGSPPAAMVQNFVDRISLKDWGFPNDPKKIADLPLHRAILKDCCSDVLEVLIKAGLPIDQTHGNKYFSDHDRTALYLAIAKRRPECAALLLNRGADPARIFSGGRTLLYLLAEKSYLYSDETAARTARLLLEHKAATEGLSTFKLQSLHYGKGGGKWNTAFDLCRHFDRPELAKRFENALTVVNKMKRRGRDENQRKLNRRSRHE